MGRQLVPSLWGPEHEKKCGENDLNFIDDWVPRIPVLAIVSTSMRFLVRSYKYPTL